MKLTQAHKKEIITLILAQLASELSNCEEAANNAHKAAVDDQSVAETQYDTLAIEAAYLAEGQSRRLLEIKASVAQYQKLLQQLSQQICLDENSAYLCSGALIELFYQITSDKQTANQELQQYYFIGPSAGGLKVTISVGEVIVITLASPIGKAINNKTIDDDYEFQAGNKIQSGYIANIT